jgi:hypothetical protein
MDIEDLKAQIVVARSRGDNRELERLQAVFRTHPGAMVTSAGRGRGYSGSMQLVAQGPARNGHTSDGADSPWPTTVDLGYSLREELDSFDGRENGGFLAGPIASPGDDGVMYVTRSMAPSDDGDRTRYSVSLDLEWAVRNWTALPSNETLLGDYHLHAPEADTRGSSQDVSAWQGMAKFFNKPWLGIVGRTAPATAVGINGRSREIGRLEITATLVRPDGSSRELTVV